MSDSYLFRNKKTGYQIQIFGTSLKDAKIAADVFIGSGPNIEYIGKNIQTSSYTCAAVTDKQREINRRNFERIMSGL